MNLLNIAQTMRKFRLLQGMTLESLAERSGLTKGYLSRLENFRVSPSLPALSKIAAALGVPVSAFFEDDYKAPPFVEGSLSSGEEMQRDEGVKFGLRYFSLAFDKIDRNMDPFLILYSTSKAVREMNMHDADEFYLVLEGKVDFFVCDMGGRRTLSEGGSIYLSGNVPHTSTLAKGCRSAKALVIYCNPPQTGKPRKAKTAP